MMTGSGVDGSALWGAVAHALTEELVPALPHGHERDIAVQLAGVAEWARGSHGVTDVERARILAAALGHGSVGAELPGLLAEAGRVLVDAVEGEPSARADTVRSALCELLDRDFAAAEPLLASFAGHRAEDVDRVPREIPERERRMLAIWLHDRLGGQVEVTSASVIPGGHSRRMLRIGVSGSEGERELVVRVEQHGLFGTDGTREAGVLRAVADAGVPVPAVFGVETSDVMLGQPFFVMDFVDGSSAVTEPALSNYVRTLHDVHRLDPAIATDALGPVPASGREAIEQRIEELLGIYRNSAPLPIPLLEEAATWLRRYLRPTGDPVLVHGDPGPGNFLHADGDILAMTDWEFAHYGDPCEDWAYLAAIRGRKVMSRVEWQASLRHAIGVTYDAETWRLWETFNLFKGSCVNLTALRLFADGVSAAPNLLAIGTAVQLRFLRQLALAIGADPARAA